MTRRCVILDVDGTLVDSNDAHAHAWVEAFREAGREIDFGRVRRLIGMGGDKLMPEAAGLHEESPEGKAISDRRGEIFRSKYLPALAPFPRVRELLARLRHDGFELVVASSATAEELEPLLKVAGADDLLAQETSSDDAEESKPEPDIVEAAVTKSRCSAQQAVMVGDTPYDVEAATRAGVRIVAVRCGGWDLPDLAGAVAVFNDPAEMLARYDDLLAILRASE
jgi:HAD superfamily hydrolase (TIGR01509 family)